MRRTLALAAVLFVAAAGPAGGSLQVQDVCACGSGNWWRFVHDNHIDCVDLSPGGVYIHGC